MTHRTSPPTTAAAPDPVDIETMRATARRAHNLRTPPPAEDLRLLLSQLRGHLELMIPEVEERADREIHEAVLRYCALAGVAEARRKLDPESTPGVHGGMTYARRLARALDGLCQHYADLTGPRS